MSLKHLKFLIDEVPCLSKFTRSQHVVQASTTETGDDVVFMEISCHMHKVWGQEGNPHHAEADAALMMPLTLVELGFGHRWVCGCVRE